MTEKEHEARLTSAAREALDELVGDHKERLLLRAHAHASQLTGDVREISVRDILTAARELVDGPHIGRRSSLVRIAQLYQMFGLITATVGVFLYLVPRLDTASAEISEVLPLIVSMAGLLVGMTGVVFARRLESRAEAVASGEGGPLPDRTEAMGLFLIRWNELELILRSMVASTFGESTAGEPIGLLIQKIRLLPGWNTASESSLRQLLETRNRMVHGGHELSPTDLRQAVLRLEEVIRQLERVRQRRI